MASTPTPTTTTARCKEANRSWRPTSLVELDLADAALGDLVASADGVFHLAAQPGVRGSWGETFPHYCTET